jgi:ABC-type Fe3+-hydroxamate transport system substrate-binding protein
MGRVAAAVALALAAVALAGCGERSEPTGARAPLYPVTVENRAGAEPVTLTARPERVVAVDRAALRILRALGVTATLAADEHGNPKPRVLERAHPDLVVGGPSNDPLRLQRLHSEVDAPFYVADGSSVAAIGRSTLELGELTDRAVQARRLLAAFREAKQRVAAESAGVTPTVFVDLGLFSTAGGASLIGELIRAAGGRDVVEGEAEPGPIRLSRLARLDPDVYIASSDSGTTLASLRADPATSGLRAVREGRVAIVPARLLEPGPYLGQAVLRLAAALHARAGG